MIQPKGHVLLVNPWIVDFAAYDFWIKPFGLLQIGSLLNENGYNVTLLDCLDRFHPALKKDTFPRPKTKADGTGHFIKEILPKPEWIKNIPRKFGRYGLPLHLVKKTLQTFSKPDVIFVTSSMTYWYPGVHEMISILKTVFPGVPIVLGGIYATLYTNHAREKSGADIVIKGKGKIAALKIADDLTGHQSDLSQYKTMNDFPAPLYDLYPNLHSAALLTSRGCPYRCPFCASHTLSGKYRKRDVDLVFNEIADLSQRRGVKHFAFYDDALFYRKDKHLMPLLQKIIDQKLQVQFHTPNGIQPKEVDKETARFMFDSRFETVRLSFESVSEDRQKQMGFKVCNDDLVQAVSNLKEAGFDSRQIGSYVLMGLPGQSAEEVLESMLFVLKQKIKVSLASFSPIPGTRSWESAIQDGLISLDTDPLLTNNSVFPFLSSEIPYETCVHLGTLASTANGMIERGEDPISSPRFTKVLNNFHF